MVLKILINNILSFDYCFTDQLPVYRLVTFTLTLAPFLIILFYFFVKNSNSSQQIMKHAAESNKEINLNQKEVRTLSNLNQYSLFK